MKKISRFDLADFNSPERIVEEIIRQVSDLPIPVPVDELALMLDIDTSRRWKPRGMKAAY